MTAMPYLQGKCLALGYRPMAVVERPLTPALFPRGAREQAGDTLAPTPLPGAARSALAATPAARCDGRNRQTPRRRGEWTHRVRRGGPALRQSRVRRLYRRATC